MDVSFLGGPQPQRGVGVVAPFDFALDRELWRWVPDEVSLHLTRTPFVPVEVSLDLARLVSEHETLQDAVRALSAVAPEVAAYACTSGSLTPYTRSVTDSLEDYLGEAGITVTGRAYLGLTRHIWKVPYRDVVDMAREAVVGSPDALFISCTNLPTYDVIPQLEAELRMPVLSANQVTVWAALREIGAQAVGPYQALLDPVARRGPAGMASSCTVADPMASMPPMAGPVADAEPEAALAGAASPGPDIDPADGLDPGFGPGIGEGPFLDDSGGPSAM
jgi:maleate isomerase